MIFEDLLDYKNTVLTSWMTSWQDIAKNYNFFQTRR